MNLVSNFIGDISKFEFGNKNITQDFDLGDTTFSNLLNKQLDKNTINENFDILKNLGIPTGLQIEGINSTNNVEFDTAITNKINNIEEIVNNNNLDNIEHSAEGVVYFSSILDDTSSNTNSQPELFNFAKKQATNLYHKYGRSMVSDVNEFINDIHKIVK